MKKVASYLILLLTVGLCGACSDVLDIDPTDRYSPASVWSDRDAVDKYVFAFYGMLKEKDGRTFDALTAHYRTVVRYLVLRDMGMVLGYGCGTPTMTPRSP